MEDHGLGTSNNALKAMVVVAALVAGLSVAVTIKAKKAQRVKKQVEAYEKTLPAEYLEYKQAVEHYRDSLMHAKGR